MRRLSTFALTPFANSLGYLDDLSQLEGSEEAEAASELPSVEAASAASWIDFVGGAVTLT